jgi:hypothetical protein
MYRLLYKKLCVLPTWCIYALKVIVKTNSCHFPKQHSLIGLYHGDSLFAVRSEQKC